jgi:hypothetical protein
LRFEDAPPSPEFAYRPSMLRNYAANTNVNLVMVNGEYWVSKDVKGYKELKAMGTKVASIVDHNPMLSELNIPAMVEKLDGFPVYTVNHVMGGTVQSTLKKIEQKPLNPALFRIPKDYTLVQKAHP